MHKVTVTCQNSIVANVIVKLFTDGEIQALINRKLRKLGLEYYEISEDESHIVYNNSTDSTEHEVSL